MYDRVQTNLKIKGNFCYYLGSMKFPYTDEPVLADDIQCVIWNKGKLSRIAQGVKTKDGTKHLKLYYNGKQSILPRHPSKEIPKQLVEKIKKQLGL